MAIAHVRSTTVTIARMGLLFAALSVSAQSQSLIYETGCAGLFPEPLISAGGSTLPGENAYVRLDGAPPGAIVILHIGNEPADLDVSGFEGVAPGCRLLANPNVAYLILNADGAGSLQLGFKMSAAFGSDLYFQWAVIEQVAPASITLTPGLRISVKDAPYLHVVIHDPGLIVDHDLDNSASVLLDGSSSHTHEFGHALVSHTWYVDGLLAASGAITSVPMSVGQHDVVLVIADDNLPASTLLDQITVNVVPPSAVPGVAARYHDATGPGPVALLDAVPATADWSELLADMTVTNGGGVVGNSPFSDEVLVVLHGSVALPDTDSYEFVASGGVDRRLFVDGLAASGPALLSAGSHSIEARFALTDLVQLPLTVELAQGGGPFGPLDPSALTHDETVLPPVVNALVPAAGTSVGGTTVTLTGSGFSPDVNLTVHWGGTDLTLADSITIADDAIELAAPPHVPGVIDVSVTTPQGSSNLRSFTYVDGGPVPDFQLDRSHRVQGPTSMDWGPDGRLYVASINGELHAFTFDDAWNILARDTYVGVSNLVNFNALALAFSPFDAASPVSVYVSHGLLYADGGGSVVAPSTYHGQVSVLSGPLFDNPLPLITGLPQSNSGHAVNGLQFDHNGDLLVLVGCMTNAGVEHLGMGELPESPLSGALLKALTSRPDFNGAVSHIETLGGAPNDDQRDGGSVDIAPGSHVSVLASGLRNPFDLVVTTDKRVYATDNGPNATFGPGSTGPNSETAFHPAHPDELLLMEPGVYYGSANRNRGRTDPRQDIYRDPNGPAIPGEFRQTLTLLASSTDGISEYRADTFGGAMRGDLLVQRWNEGSKRITLSADGRSVESVVTLSADVHGVEVQPGPGGVILVADYSFGVLKVLQPVDAPVTAMEVLDVFPWRAPATGGVPFVLGGRDFGSLIDTTVTFDGIPAVLDSVSPTRIRGTIPAQPAPDQPLVDIAVVSNGQADTLAAAFRYLFVPIGSEPGDWETLGDMPLSLGEVAAGVVGSEIFIVGEGSPLTLTHDVASGTWHTTHAARPFAGHHHAAEVIGDRLFLIGGIGGGSPGRVQIYDHDADLWSVAADMPWPGGSVSSASIDGLIYAAGGIVGGSTVANTAVYDPAANTWTALAPMPVGRNHAAAATDGTLFWVFGGRSFGNTVTNGFDDVQVYDPATDTWAWDKDGVSGLTPLPLGRGGMGRAVFWWGEFYVFGGETLNGPGATPEDVYDRVDVYDPLNNNWRLDAPMPVPRHGLFPVLFEGRMFLPGGGTSAGASQSNVLDTFRRH